MSPLYQPTVTSEILEQSIKESLIFLDENKRSYRITRESTIELFVTKDPAEKAIHLLAIDYQFLLEFIDTIQSDILKDLKEPPGSINDWMWFIYCDAQKVFQYQWTGFQNVEPDSEQLCKKYMHYLKYMSASYTLLYRGFRGRIMESSSSVLEEILTEAALHDPSKIVGIIGNHSLLTSDDVILKYKNINS